MGSGAWNCARVVYIIYELVLYLDIMVTMV